MQCQYRIHSWTYLQHLRSCLIGKPRNCADTILEPTWAWCEDSDFDQCSLFDNLIWFIMVYIGLQFIDNAGTDFLKYIITQLMSLNLFLSMHAAVIEPASLGKLLQSLESLVHLGWSYLVLGIPTLPTNIWLIDIHWGSLSAELGGDGMVVTTCSNNLLQKFVIRKSTHHNQSISQWDIQHLYWMCFNRFIICFTHDRECKHVIHRG